MMHWQNLGPTPLWSKQGARLLLLAAIACVFCIVQRANNGPIIISTDRFQLVIEGKRFFLQSVVEELSNASKKGCVQESLLTYTHPHVLLVDELGYLTYGPDAANVLFHVVNDRHLRKRP